MLVVETDRLRCIGIYMRPKSQREHWLQLLGRLEQFKAKSLPTIVCGDFNAHYPDWTRGKTDAGGTAVRAFVQKTSGGPIAHRVSSFAMNAPASPTCSRPSHRGIVQSTIDLFLVASSQGLQRIRRASTCRTRRAEAIMFRLP